MGTAALQVAKHFGARVTSVCSTGNIDLVKSLGADDVVDYTKEDFTRAGRTYDVIFDAVGLSSFSRCPRSLAPRGIYMTTVPFELVIGVWLLVKGAPSVNATGMNDLEGN